MTFDDHLVEISNIINSSNNEITFNINNKNVDIHNKLRRIMISQIPIVAIDNVIIEINNTKHSDDDIVHRLKLIPLISPRIIKDEESKNTTILQLHVKSKEDHTIIKSKQITSTSNSIKPYYDDIPIIHLHKNEEIKLICHTKIGIGSQHAKWSPTTTVRFYKEIDSLNYTFVVESTGSLKAIEIVELAIQLYNKEKTKL